MCHKYIPDIPWYVLCNAHYIPVGFCIYPIAPGVPTPDFEVCMCITVVIQLTLK